MKLLFIGNPGTGKSTLLNGVIGKAEFRSGNSYGHGLTTHLQLKQDKRTGCWYGDTPGLSDIRLRKQAAKEITKALKSGDDDYKLFFVVTEEAGRVRPADITTMTCVLDAIAQEGSLSNPPYGIIVNKITEKKKKKLYEDPNARNAFVACLNNGKYATPSGHSFPPHIHLYERIPDLEDEENQVHKVSQELLTFLGKLPSIRIKSEKVKDVRVDQYEAMLQKMAHKVDSLRSDNAELEKKMKKDKERLAKQVEDRRKDMNRMLKEKEKRMEQHRKELEKARREALETARKLEEEKGKKEKERQEREKMRQKANNRNRHSSGNDLDKVVKAIVSVPKLFF